MDCYFRKRIDMITLIIFILFIGCSRSEVVEMPLTKASDTAMYYRPRPPKQDTTRREISFDVTVEGWNEITIKE